MRTKRRAKASRRVEKQRKRCETKALPPGQPRKRSFIGKLDDTQIGLADLPPELRDIIYEYALSPRKRVPIPFSFGARMALTKDIAFGLLSTCKIVYKEARNILFERNDFRIDLVHIPHHLRAEISEFKDSIQTCADDESVPNERPRKKWWLTDPRRPRLSETLQIFPSRGLAAVRKFHFAYHAREPSTLKELDEYDLDRGINLVLTLKFVKRKPFYQIQLAKSGRLREDLTTYDHLTSYIVSIIEERGLRCLSKRDVYDFAAWIGSQCDC